MECNDMFLGWWKTSTVIQRTESRGLWLYLNVFVLFQGFTRVGLHILPGSFFSIVICYISSQFCYCWIKYLTSTIYKEGGDIWIMVSEVCLRAAGCPQAERPPQQKHRESKAPQFMVAGKHSPEEGHQRYTHHPEGSNHLSMSLLIQARK